MTAENEARGRSNRRKGNYFRDRCISALRTVRLGPDNRGWPNASSVPHTGRGDITGCGDLTVECKDETSWAHLSDACAQAERDARHMGMPTFVVWRKRHGWSDPMDGWCVQPARQFWADRKEMERLEAVELEFAAWRAGLAAAAQAREAAG